MPYASNRGADQPAHPHSQISAFVVRCLDSIIYLETLKMQCFTLNVSLLG